MEQDIEENNLPGWGHWADPAGEELEDDIDQEVIPGEFLELADLMKPLEEQPVVQEEIDINKPDL